MVKFCNSCQKKIVNQIGHSEFKCPSCGKHLIVRCNECKENFVKYVCPDCQFEGP